MITGGLAGLARVAPVAGCRPIGGAEGTNLEEVREALGHRDSRTTRHYAKRYQWDVRRKVIDKLPDPEGPLALLVAAVIVGVTR